MTREELDELIGRAAEQIVEITDATVGWTELIKGAERMRANEDAQIYLHLADAFKKLIDENVYPTIIDPQGYRKTITIESNTLEVVVTHREPKLEKLKGVDVYYNLKGIKAVAFQHKKRGKNGYISFSKADESQRDKIKALCGLCRLPPRARTSEAFIKSNCSSLYIIGDAGGERRHAVSACQLETYREHYTHASTVRREELPHPVEMEVVDKMFLQCLVGKRLNNDERVAFGSIRDAFLTHPDILIEAELRSAII